MAEGGERFQVSVLSPHSHPLVASDLGPGCFRKPYPKASLTSLLSDGTSVCDEVRLPIQGGESRCLGNHCASDTAGRVPSLLLLIGEGDRLSCFAGGRSEDKEDCLSNVTPIG